MIEMERHVKPAVILGKATFEQDIVNELIEEVEIQEKMLVISLVANFTIMKNQNR
jgi:hypothetical protein